MDSLRESVGLRAYGQRDPLVEYQAEAYKVFEELMTSIKSEICHNIFRSASSLLALNQFQSRIPSQNDPSAGQLLRHRPAGTSTATASTGGKNPSDMVTEATESVSKAQKGQAGPHRPQSGPQRPLPLRQRQEIQTMLRQERVAGGTPPMSDPGETTSDGSVGSDRFSARRMRLQKFLQFFRRLSPKTGHFRNLLHAGQPQALHRAEPLQQRRLAPAANPRKFIQDALGNPLQPQLGVVGVGKAMRLIPHPLQQFQRARIMAQSQRLGFPGPENLLKFLGQADDRNPLQTQRLPIPPAAALSCPLPPSIRIKSGSETPPLPRPLRRRPDGARPPPAAASNAAAPFRPCRRSRPGPSPS